MQDIIYSLPGAKNIPIGNYTSQWMGNLYLNELDQLVKTRMKIQKYVRYCDDFIILDNDKAKLQSLKSEIIGFLQERLKLVLGKAEVFPTSHGIDFLGYRHFPGGYILLRKSTAKRIKKRCTYIDGLLSAGIGDRKRIESQVSSAIGWIMWANTHHLKEKCKMEELLWRIRNGR